MSTRAVAVAIAAVAVFSLSPAMRGSGADPGYSWEPARTDGGGFMTVVEPSPSEPGVWLAASDAAGVFRSSDGGVTWQPPAHGFEAPDLASVASIVFDRTQPGRVYACSGQTRPTGAFNGAFERSDDDGQSFVTTSVVVGCNGSNTKGSQLPQPHPRSIGRLIVPDPITPNKVWLATYHDGVRMSLDGGTTWAAKGLVGSFLRGLIIDPANPNVLYAAVRTESNGGGVYRTKNANAAAPTWRKISGAPLAEELAIAGRRLYVAAGNKGLFTADLGAPTPTLTKLTSLAPFLAASTDVYEVIAARVGNADVVTVGLDQDAKCTGAFCPTILRSTNGGTSWVPLPATGAGVHPTVGGPNGPGWRQAAHPSTLLGGSDHVVASIRYDPYTPGALLAAGRAGIWRSTDDGANWWPVVRGLATTFHLAVAADPVVGGRVLAGVADWDLMSSVDGGRTLSDVDLPAEATAAAALSGWTGPGGAPMYVGTTPSSGRGDVLVQEQPNGAFASLGVAGASTASGVIAVAARLVAGERVVIALTVEKGLWRKQGGSPWGQVATAPGTGNGSAFPRLARALWAPDGGAIFVSDRGTTTGVWRSLDAGLTWDKVSDGQFDIAVDAGAPERLWLAGSGMVERVDAARLGTVATGGLTVNASTAFPRARLVSVGPSGEVIAVAEDDSTVQIGVTVARAQIRRSTDEGASWDDIGDATFAAGAVDPVSAAIGADGAIHVVTHGAGWWVGRPAA